ncbi:hypothetical protein ABGB18_35935 [Nonomuraea sp. B12E4]|uniref:hypothetical protein n=1 Tax=Nonomuraea sp. B12E4 TaxID=3153564 RepID=UPI00325DDCFC
MCPLLVSKANDCRTVSSYRAFFQMSCSAGAVRSKRLAAEPVEAAAVRVAVSVGKGRHGDAGTEFEETSTGDRVGQ